MLLLAILGCVLTGLAACGGLTKSDNQALQAFSSNKGEKTYYEFRFTAENSITQQATMEVVFPADFAYICFPKEPECFVRQGSTDDSSYNQVGCSISSSGVVVISVGSLVSKEEITLIVGQVTNPQHSDSTSQFRVRTYSRDVVIDTNDQFGFISFANSPKIMTQAAVYKLSNTGINEGSSWEFRFTPKSTYSSGNSLRFTFPDGFKTKQVSCDVDGISGTLPNASVQFNQRVTTCSGMQKALLGGEQSVVKIINMQNPYFSGIMSGFMVEILQARSTVVLEKIEFPGDVIISPGKADIFYTSSDQFRLSNSTYSFFINFLNPVPYGGKLFLNFTNEWTIFNQNCTVVDGLIAHKNDVITCSRVHNVQGFVVDNFQKIDNTKRIVISVQIQTPDTPNQYPVTIFSYNSQRNSIVDTNAIMVTVNSTYGITKQYVAHSMLLPARAASGKCGSLQMEFFLKTFLPKSDIDSFGKFRVDIFPQVPIPDANIYGPVQCTFYGDKFSANKCEDTTHSIFDTDSTRLKLYIYTPKAYSFQKSEVPITVSTSGKNQQYCSGLVLDPLVQRYLFHVHIWSRQNTMVNLPDADANPDILTTVPDEVYFTEYIPSPRYINGPNDPDAVSSSYPNKPTYPNVPTLTANSLGKEASSLTYIDILYTHQDTCVKDYLLRAANVRNYIMKVFFKQGWDATLGYTLPTTDKVFKNYPCILKGSLIDSVDPTAEHSACDLYIGSIDYPPYLQINNIPTLLFDVGNFISIGIPKIKITSSVGIDAIIWIDVLEETPGYWDPTVPIYRTQNLTLFTTYSASSVGTGTMTFTPSTLVLNAIPTFTLQFPQSSTAISAAAIQWDVSLPISFAEVVCTGSSGATKCVKFGYPVYWILIRGVGVQATTVNIILPTTTSVNPAHQLTFTMTEQSWNSGNKQIQNKNSLTYSYLPMVMTSTFSALLPTASYQYQGYVSSHTMTFVLIQPVPDNWYLQFDFTGSITVVNNDQFLLVQTGLVALDQRGLLYTFSGSTFIIYNIQGLPLGSSITVTLSLTMPQAASCVAQVTISTEYVVGSSNFRVNKAIQVHADSPFTLTPKAMNKFKIMNPIIQTMDPPEGYIGPFDFVFVPYYTVGVGATLTMYWQRKTGSAPGFDFLKNSQFPTQVVTIVCTINKYVHPCTSTNTDPVYLIVTMSPYIAIYGGTQYAVTITTDTAKDFDGLVFPAVSNYYQFRLASSYPATYNTYIFIRPIDFTGVTLTFAHSTASQPNIMELEFIPSRTVSSYSTGGRIQFFFPLYQDSRVVYDLNLGLGSKDPGCWFYPSITLEAPATRLKCVLTSGGDGVAGYLDRHYAVIDLINFNSFIAGTTYKFMIGGVVNPAASVTQFRLTLMTSQITPATNAVTYLNSQIIFVMLIQTAYVSNTPINQVTIPGYVQDTANYELGHSITFASAPITPTDYYITDWTLNPILFGTVRNSVGFNVGNMDSCNLSIYTQCILMEEVKWIIWRLVATLPAGSSVSAPIPFYNTFPKMIQRTVTQFHSHVIISGKYVAYVTENIALSAWNVLRQTSSGASMSLVRTPLYYMKNRKKTEIMIQFTTTLDLYASGSIEIIFKAGYVPYNHCRSAVPSGSQLFSVAGNNIGEIGCQVQSNSWYITGFQLLPRNSVVKILGHVDLPATASTFDIYTYGTRDMTSINANGQTIEFITGVTAVASVGTDNSFAFNKQMLFQQSEPLRPGHVGEFRMLLKQAYSYTATFYLMFNRCKLIAATCNAADGFQPLPAGARMLAYFIKVSDGTISPLALTGIDTQPTYINYGFSLGVALAANTDYFLVATTQSLDSTIPDGLVFPKSEGLYGITMWSTSYQLLHTQYIEVYGAPFTSLTFISTNNQKGENNLFYLTFQPSYAISTSSLFVFEFNTQLLDSLNLFDQKLGYTLKTHQQVPVDFVSGVASGSGQCYLYSGFTTNSVAARIVCTGFAVSTSTTVEMFITAPNPASVPDDTYVPIFIYTLDTSASGEYSKKNWQIIDQDYLVYVAAVQSTAAVTPTRSNSDLSASSGIIFTFPLPISVSAGDYLVVNANFTGVPAVSTKTSVTCTSGTFYLLGFNKKLVCMFTSAVSASTNIDFATLGTDQFFNPLQILATSELQLSGFISYQSDLTKQDIKIPCNPMVQLNALAIPPTFITVANPIFVQSNVIGQFTDFIYTITSTNLDKVTYLRISHGMTGVTLDTTKVECQMANGSNIEIYNCYHDGSTYFLTISPAKVSTALILSFVTKSMPLSTPSSSAPAAFSPIIKLYDSSSVLIFTATIAPSTISLFSDPDPVITTPSITSFNADEISFSQSRYFDFIPFFISNGGTQTGPVSFQYSCQQAQSAGSTITFQFPSFLTAVNNAVQAIYSTVAEFYKFFLVCKMNGVVFSGCWFSSGLFTITLPQSMTLNTIYTFHFTVVDQSQYPSLQGFYFANTAATDSTVGFVTIQTPSYTIQTDLIYFGTNQALYGNSITGSSSSISSVHPAADQPNLLTINLTINTSSVTLLIFEFQYASSAGTPLYSSPTMGFTSRFPCTGGTSTTAPPRCWIQPGFVDSSSKLSQPIRMFMSKFTYTSGTAFKIYLMVTNPILNADMILRIQALDGAGESQQTMSGQIKFSKILRSVSLPSAITQSITQSTPQSSGSTTYSLPRQGTSNLLILLPLSSCSYTGSTATQIGMLIYQQPVTNKLFKVLVDTSGTPSAISLSSTFCPQPTNIQYFETDTYSTLFYNLGQITSSTISSSSVSSGFSIVSSRTRFYSVGSFTGAQGVITFAISSTILMQQTLSLTVSISSGITISGCGARAGFFSTTSQDISLSLVTCVVSTSTSFVLSNFNKLDSAVKLEIQLIYNTDSSTSSDPNITLLLEAYPSMAQISQTLNLGYGIVQSTSYLSPTAYPLQQQGVTYTYQLTISIDPINTIVIDSSVPTMTLTVVLTFQNEFQLSSVFQNAICNTFMPISIISQTGRLFSNPQCLSSAAGVVTLSFDANDATSYWLFSDPLVFNLLLDNVNDLQVSTPYHYKSQFYFVSVNAYTDSSSTNQSLQQIQLIPSTGPLCSSFTATSITSSGSQLTEMQFSISNTPAVSSTNGDYLTIEFDGSTAFPVDIISNIPSTTLKIQIDCLCYQSTATQLSNIYCYRHYAQAQSGQSILSIHGLNLSASSSVQCFIPQIITPSSVPNNSGVAYLTLYNGPMFVPNQGSSTGSLSASTSTGYTFGVIGNSYPTITVSSTTTPLVYSSSPTTLTLTSSGVSFNANTYFYVLFDIQSPTSYILSYSTACSGNLSICRVYKTLVNLLVIKQTSGNSITIDLSQSTLTTLTQSAVINKLPHKFIFIQQRETLNPSSYSFSSVSGPSSVLTPTVTTTTLYPLRDQQFSPFIFTYTPPASFAFPANSGIRITPNTYQLSTCQAYTTSYQFTCSVSSNTATILIGVLLPASTTISIAFTGTMTESTTTSFSSNYYSSYISSTNYQLAGSMSFSISYSSAAPLDITSTVPFRLCQFHPIIQVAALSSFAPIRVSITHTSDISTSFSSLKLYLQTSSHLLDSVSSSSSTAKQIDCFYKEFDAYGSFRILPPDTCTMQYDSANSYNIITAGLPLKGDLSTDKFIIGSKYELIITSNTFTTTPGVKMSTNEVIPAKLLLSSSSFFYSETLFSFMDNPTSFALSKFYYTTSNKNTDTSIYFEVTAPSIGAYPSQYLEIILVDLAGIAFTTLTAQGLTIPCYVSSASIPPLFVISPFCVVHQRKNDLVIKLLSSNSFSGLIKIALDDIRLPTSPVAYSYFSFKIQAVGIDATSFQRPYLLGNRHITHTFSYTNPTSISYASPAMVLNNAYFGQPGVQMYFQNIITNPISFNIGNWHPIKVKIRTTGGYFNMAENPTTPSQFYERSGYIYQLIWMNPNSHTIIAESTNTTYYYIQPFIIGLNNPSLSTKAIFSASPISITYWFYTSYTTTTIFTPTLAVSYASFSVNPTGISIDTNTVGFYFPPNSLMWFQIIVYFNNQPAIFANTQGSEYTTLTLTSTNGISAFYECAYASNTGIMGQIGCEVQSSTSIVLGNVALGTATPWYIYVRGISNNGNNNYLFTLTQYLYSVATGWTSFVVWQFNSGTTSQSGWRPTYVEPTSGTGSVNKFFYNYHERQLKFIKPSFAQVHEANFQFTPDANLAIGAVITFTFQDYTTTIIDPGTKKLFCLMMKQLGSVTYRIGRKTTCSYSAGVFTFVLTAPMTLGNTYLLNMRLDKSETGYFAAVSSLSQQQYFTVSMNSENNLEILSLKNSFQKLVFTQNSFTAGAYDYFKIDVTPQTAIPAGTTISESILYVELQYGQYPYDAGLVALYNTDSTPFYNGQISDFKSPSGSLSSAVNIAQVGNAALSQNFRFSIVKFSSLSAGSTFQLRIPMITNGAGGYQVMVRVRSVVYLSTAPTTEFVINEDLFIRNNQFGGSTGAVNYYSYYLQYPSSNVQTAGTANIKIFVSCPGGFAGDTFILKPVSTLAYDYKNYDGKIVGGISLVEQFSASNSVVMWITSNFGYIEITIPGFTTFDEAIPFKFAFGQTSYNSVSSTASSNLGSYSGSFPYFTSSAWGVQSAVLSDSTTNNPYSNSIITINVKTRKLIVGSSIRLQASNMYFSNHYIHKISANSGVLPANTNDGIQIVISNSDTYLTFLGFAEIPAGTLLTMVVGFRNVAWSNTQYLYSSFGPNGYLIEQYYVTALGYYSSSYFTSFTTTFRRVQLIQPGNWGPLQFNFNTIANPVNFAVSTNHLELTIPNDFSVASGGTQVIEYEKTTDVNWIYPKITPFAVSPTTISLSPPATIFDIIQGTEYQAVAYTYAASGGNNGFKYPANIGYYTFSLVEFEAPTAAEYQYNYFRMDPPVDDYLLALQSLSTQAGDWTVIRFKWQIQITSVSGDEIWIEFPTNGYGYNDGGTYLNGQIVFEQDLGLTGQVFPALECLESGYATLISNSKILCDIIQHGDKTTYPPYNIPTIIRVQIKKTIPAGTVVEFFIAGIRNPLYNLRRAQITISLRKPVVQPFFSGNDRYPSQISKGEYTTTAATSYFTQYSGATKVSYLPAGTFPAASFSATGIVWDLARVHTWNLFSNSNFNNNDWVAVYYTLNNNSQMSTSCTYSSSSCYIFPSLGLVIIKVTGATGSSKSMTFTIGNMNNGLFRYGGVFYVEHWSSTGALLTAYINTGLYYTYYTTPITVTLKPTLTPQELTLIDNYWLRDFENIAKITVQGSWVFSNIKSFWLEKPAEIYQFDLTHPFCNATLTVPPALRTPYPYRFHCQVTTTSVLLELTDDFPVYSLSNQGTYIITIYVGLDILEFAPSGLTGDFNFMALALQVCVKDSNYGVTYSQGSITISTYIQPDVRHITFQKSSFENRKATPGSQVQLLALIEPLTPLSQYQVNKFVFRIPDQYTYPAVKSLDSCTMIGKTQTVVNSCSLVRDHGHTYITIIPDALYDNKVKTFTITDSNFNFGVPIWPGDFYNMTLYIYSGSILLEKQTLNLTRILGYPYTANSVAVNSLADPLQKGLFYFDAQLNAKDVLPGYNTDAATMHTSLEYTFANAAGEFPADLGTGLSTGDEIPCISDSGITTYAKGKLTCIITLGFDPDNLPTINVYGYDLIKAGTAYRMFFPLLTSLDLSLYANINSRVKIYYNDINYSAIYYETQSYSSVVTTAASSLTSIIQSVTTSANNLVGQKRDYTFTFSLVGTLATTDYLILTFPQNYFDKKGDFSVLTCAGFTVQVYTLSNQIYLQPTLPQSGTINFVLSQLINPAYSQNKAVSIIGQQLSSMKYVALREFQLNHSFNSPILPCNSFSSTQMSASTTISGQNDVTFTLTFTTGHYVPQKTGAITLTTPTNYIYSLTDMGTTCSLVGFSDDAICQIGSSNRVDIFLRSTFLNQAKEYTVILYHMNAKVLLPSGSFTIASLFSENIYLQEKICETSVAYPLFVDSGYFDECQIQIQSSILTAGASSLYSFTIQCNARIRDNSLIQINLAKEYFKANNSTSIKNLECFSPNPVILRSSKCHIERNGRSYYLSVQLNSIDAQTLFQIQIVLANPKEVTLTGYAFSADIFSYLILYAKAVAQTGPNIVLLSTSKTISTTSQIGLRNIPRNAGSSSTYVFTVPSLIWSTPGAAVQTINIDFSNEFSSGLGSDISCGIEATNSLVNEELTYSLLLNLTQSQTSSSTSNYTSITCSVSKVSVSIDLSSISSLTLEQTWHRLIITGVTNPQSFNSSNIFGVTYIGSSNNILFSFNSQLLYRITAPPQFMKLSNISTSTPDLRVLSSYLFQAQANTYLPAAKQVLVSISLPIGLYGTVYQLYESLTAKCQINGMNFQASSDCSIYANQKHLEILSESTSFASLNSSTVFNFTVSSIYNPDTQHSCEETLPDSMQYVLKLIDLSSSDILLQSTPSLEDFQSNCAVFYAISYQSTVSGQLQVLPGIQYPYTISLSQPASNLTITPQSTSNQLKFSPKFIQFDDFIHSSQVFSIGVSSDTPPGDYTIFFTMNQTFPKSNSDTSNSAASIDTSLTFPAQFFRQILPLTLSVLPASLYPSPTVSIPEQAIISIGLPLLVQVVISTAPSQTIYLVIKIPSAYSSLVSISPSSIEIPSGSLTSSFYLTVSSAVVPDTYISMALSLTSYLPLAHVLPSTTKYISFTADRSFSSQFNLLKIHIADTYTATPLNDKLKPVLLNSSSSSALNLSRIKNLQPTILSCSLSSSTQNSATVRLVASSQGFAYATISKYGYPAPTVISIKNQDYTSGVSFVFLKEIPYSLDPLTGVVNYETQVIFTNLVAQTNYKIYLFVESAFGQTGLTSLAFKTPRAQFAHRLTVPLTTIVPCSSVIQGLAMAMKISTSRLTCLANTTQLQAQQDSLDSEIMRFPQIKYEIIMSANLLNENEDTNGIIVSLQTDNSVRQLLKQILNAFQIDQSVLVSKIIDIVPTISSNLSPISINYNNVTFEMSLWQQGRVFAVIRDTYSIDPSNPPVSSQIALGNNENNGQLSNYQVINQLTDTNGHTVLFFDDLDDGTNYNVYVTLADVESTLPYNLLEDNEIIILKFQTPFNMNLGNYEDPLAAIAQTQPDLAAALKRFMN